MIVTNAHQLVALDSTIDTLYGQVADLDQRGDLSKPQKNVTRSALIRRAVLLRRRREGLPA
jgi:hypothetical protein